MTDLDIRRRRLRNHGLSTTPFEQPEDVVRWLGAVQSQDYPAACWGLGLRMREADGDAIERAFNEGRILRTHVLRPTWHFVTPEDIRWIVELTAPRVHALNALYYRNLELDAETIKRSAKVMTDALRGDNPKTREELAQMLAQSGIATGDRLRLTYIMMRAELDGLICSGPRRGKQFTYMLLEERAPRGIGLERDEALAELLRRYLRSHGPATLHDFVWWSGLTVADARRGIEMVEQEFMRETIGERTYWFTGDEPSGEQSSPAAWLLPNYDEYGSYKHREAIFAPEHHGLPFLSHAIVIDGRIVGSWRRTLSKKEIRIETNLFAPPTAAERNAIDEAAGRYGKFLELPVVMLEER